MAESIESSKSARAAAKASNAFGLALYRAVCDAKPQTNAFISPYSMSVVLAMAFEGADGVTADEMVRVLRLAPAGSKTCDKQALHAGYAAIDAYIKAATGSVDARTLQRIASLRLELEEANRQASRWIKEAKWDDAERAGDEAETLAAELNELLAAVDRFELNVANALWVDRSCPLEPEYVRTLDRGYGTGRVSSLDIAHDAEGSRRRINEWVEEHTQKRIKDLIPRGMLEPDTRLVLTNAVYFKGQWTVPFKDEATRDGYFTLSHGETVRARMMRDPHRKSVRYAAFDGSGDYFRTPQSLIAGSASAPKTYPNDAGFQVVALDYKGSDLSMAIILPRSADGLQAIESQLTSEKLDAWLARLAPRTVDLALPRFTMESAHEMSEALCGMGMRRAFVNPLLPEGAQFPGMTRTQDPQHALFIGALRHKAWIEVNEKGTEAAAATVMMMAMAGSAAVDFVPQFHADRPFLFIIRDAKTGLILFVGRMVNPSKA